MLRRALMVALVLAGCAGPAADPGDEAPVAAAPFRLEECREQIGIFPIADDDAAPHMPEGFAPLPPLPPDVHPEADPTGASATLLHVGFFCGAPEPVSFLIPWIPAMPPEPMRQPDVTYHAVAPAVLAGHAGLVAWLAAEGIAATNASVTQTPALPETPPAITTTMSAEGVEGSLRVTGTSPRSEAATPQEWLRLFVVEEREVVAILDLHISEHVHWQFGPARAEGAIPGLVTPTQPGLSTHSAPGMTLELRAGE